MRYEIGTPEDFIKIFSPKKVKGGTDASRTHWSLHEVNTETDGEELKLFCEETGNVDLDACCSMIEWPLTAKEIDYYRPLEDLFDYIAFTCRPGLKFSKGSQGDKHKLFLLQVFIEAVIWCNDRDTAMLDSQSVMSIHNTTWRMCGIQKRYFTMRRASAAGSYEVLKVSRALRSAKVFVCNRANPYKQSGQVVRKENESRSALHGLLGENSTRTSLQTRFIFNQVFVFLLTTPCGRCDKHQWMSRQVTPLPLYYECSLNTNVNSSCRPIK